eukprot:g535.t1
MPAHLRRGPSLPVMSSSPGQPHPPAGASSGPSAQTPSPRVKWARDAGESRTSAILSDLSFKEHEFKRRVGLFSTTSSSKWTGSKVELKDIQRNAADAVATTEFEQLHEQKWYDRLRAADGVTDAETLIVRNEIMKNKAQLMQMWSSEAMNLLTLQAEEDAQQEQQRIRELEKKGDEIEGLDEIIFMGTEMIAAVINRTARTKLIKAHRASLLETEPGMRTTVVGERRDLASELYARCMRRAEDDAKVF